MLVVVLLVVVREVECRMGGDRYKEGTGGSFAGIGGGACCVGCC